MSKPYKPKLPMLGHDLTGDFTGKTSFNLPSGAFMSAHAPLWNAFATDVVTDNVTLSDGSVINRSPENAALARDYVDENKK